jgi:hypothetical protein
MEFKIIFYILAAIAWFVVNNYKKLSEENKKRVFGKPVNYPTANEQASPVLPSKEMPPVRKKAQTSLPPVKKLPLKPVAIPRKSRKVLDVPDFSQIEQGILPAVYKQEMQHEKLEKNIGSSVLNDRNFLANAIVFGEIINRPAWSKY